MGSWAIVTLLPRLPPTVVGLFFFSACSLPSLVEVCCVTPHGDRLDLCLRGANADIFSLPAGCTVCWSILCVHLSRSQNPGDCNARATFPSKCKADITFQILLDGHPMQCGIGRRKVAPSSKFSCTGNVERLLTKVFSPRSRLSRRAGRRGQKSLGC